MSHRRLVPFVLLTLAAVCAPASAQTNVIRVPRDVKDLQGAIRSVKNGGAIELAAGTYTPSTAGYSISNLGKAFTVRAAKGATVVLDGRGQGTILRFRNGSRSRGRLVTFERITFQNGFSATEGDGGAVTLTAAQARFVDCRFLNNTATGRTTGGGAVRVLTGSEATFVRTEMRGSSSLNRGGAIEIISATVVIEGGSLVENRTNLPGHKPTATGGAIYLLDSVLRVSDARFERNQAAWVGGAIYAYGRWADPVDVPRADVTVVRSTFLDNVAINDTCCTLAGATQGGAIHVENQTTLRLQHSHFFGNRAKLGGAVNNYRAIVEVTGSLFDGNRAVEGAVLGAGGAIFAASNETAVDGGVNRRPAVLTITDSLVRSGRPEPAAHTGGCVGAGGDASRAYGDNGAIPMGTVEENRARVTVLRSVFADCDVQREPAVGGGMGGALNVSLATLLLEDSMVLDSDARGDGAGGGGVAIQGESIAAVSRTTFARNTADRWGGALFLNGVMVQVNESRFFANDVRPGISEALGDSRGAAIYSIPLLSQQRPERARNVGGMVINSVFSENAGLPLWDAEPASGPINELRYDNNQFYETAFGDRVYVNAAATSNGASVSTLNSLVVYRGGRGTTDKSASPNAGLFAPPGIGTLRAAPSAVGTGAPPMSGSFLGFAWSGRSATLDGQALTTRSGLRASGAGTHSLVVDGRPASSASFGNVTCPAGAVCLADGRFDVRVTWKNGEKLRRARLVSREADTAFFALPGGTTLAVQVLDRRDKNGHFWVVRSVSGVSALSAASKHTVRITDTRTGTTRVWVPVAGEGDTEVDRQAFPGS
jgi:hypothetical protein